MAVNFISDFEEKLAELAKSRKCDGIICGHIHKPDMKIFDGIVYMNSGDWVESLSALVEDFNNEWSLVYFHASPKELAPQIIKKEEKQTKWVAAL